MTHAERIRAAVERARLARIAIAATTAELVSTRSIPVAGRADAARQQAIHEHDDALFEILRVAAELDGPTREELAREHATSEAELREAEFNENMHREWS